MDFHQLTGTWCHKEMLASVLPFTLKSSLFFMTHVFMQKTNTTKDFCVVLWATSFSEATCLWMKVHVMPINFVSEQVTGGSSALCLARRVA